MPTLNFVVSDKKSRKLLKTENAMILVIDKSDIHILLNKFYPIIKKSIKKSYRMRGPSHGSPVHPWKSMLVAVLVVLVVIAGRYAVGGLEAPMPLGYDA